MIKFGTGGWRAIIADDFTKENVRILATALANMMKAEGKTSKGVVVGYDRRFLSREASEWIAEVMAGNGIKCMIVDREVPTPLVMYTVDKMGLPYGMMVTASHNPATYNGVKVFMEGGRDSDEHLTNTIEEYISKVEVAKIEAVELAKGIESGMIEMIDPMNDYIDNILKAIDADAIRKCGLKVVLDPMFGVSKTALLTILMTARCNVEVIHDQHDTLFGGRLPAPTAATLTSLINYVDEKKFDIGIATDGDADRLGVIDDKAEFLHPNKILVLLYYYLLKYRGWKGAAVRNLATTHLLDRIAEDFGQQCYEVSVGFKHISSKMAETDAIIGGESSGGLTVKGHVRGKDGVYAASLLIEMIAVTGRKLSEIYSEIEDKYGKFEMEEFDMHFTPEKKEEILNLVMKEKKLPDFPLEIEKISYMDGCKVYFKNGGWIIIRFSGTEPLLRVFCEMSTSAQAREMIEVVEKFIAV